MPLIVSPLLRYEIAFRLYVPASRSTTSREKPVPTNGIEAKDSMESSGVTCAMMGTDDGVPYEEDDAAAAGFGDSRTGAHATHATLAAIAMRIHANFTGLECSANVRCDQYV